MFINLLRQRRSIRKFKDQALTREQIDTLVEALLRSPSGKSTNPLEFILVDDPDMLARLSTAKPHGAALIKGAALGIVICADKDKTDTHVEDASIAAIFAHLAAADLDLGSCWVQIRNRRHQDGRSSEHVVVQLLEIPDNYCVQAVIAVGVPDETKAPHAKQDLHFHKIHKGRFGTQAH